MPYPASMPFLIMPCASSIQEHSRNSHC